MSKIQKSSTARHLFRAPKSKEASERQQGEYPSQDPFKQVGCVQATAVQAPSSGPPVLVWTHKPKWILILSLANFSTWLHFLKASVPPAVQWRRHYLLPMIIFKIKRKEMHARSMVPCPAHNEHPNAFFLCPWNLFTPDSSRPPTQHTFLEHYDGGLTIMPHFPSICFTNLMTG